MYLHGHANKALLLLLLLLMLRSDWGGGWGVFSLQEFSSRVITSAGTFFGWVSIIFWSFSLCYTYTDIFHAINNGLNRTEWSLIRSVIIGMRRVWEGSALLKMSRQF